MPNLALSNKDLLKKLRPPVARFYLYDFHIHSIASHDVCHGAHYKLLPQDLLNKLEPAEPLTEEVNASSSSTLPKKRNSIAFPLTKSPTDRRKHDCDVSLEREFVSAFYESLIARRDSVTATENIPTSDNWAILALTDHDVCEFACALSKHAWEKRSTDKLIILPGIELEVRFRIDEANTDCPLHILCLFAPCTKSSDIRIAINNANANPADTWDFGTTLDVTDLPQFIENLRNHSAYPAACIGAHVSSSKGIESEPKKRILESLDVEIIRLQGEIERARTESDSADERDLQARLDKLSSCKKDPDATHLKVLRLIGRCGFDALQVVDQSHETHYRRLHRFRDQHGRAIPIICSDSHTPNNIFNAGAGLPYIKLNIDTISNGDANKVFDEIKNRALRFGETRTTFTSPGQVSYWIEGIEIIPDASNARRFFKYPKTSQETESDSDAFILPLSRNLNCFIGGRGSGKSSLIEAIAFLNDQTEFADEAKKRAPREDWYNRAEATLRGCRLRLVWKTSSNTGIGSLAKRSLFVTRYFDPDGRHSPADLRDVVGQAIVESSIVQPKVELLRAHDIERTAKPENLRNLFDNLCGTRIEALTAEIEHIRGELKKQRTIIIDTCKTLAELTREGSPLRQYGIRKQQFERVDKLELRERYEQVDQAEVIGRIAADTCQAWGEVKAIETLDQLERRLGSFHQSATASMLDQDGNQLPGFDLIHEACRVATEGNPSLQGKILLAIKDTKAAAFLADAALGSSQEDANQNLKNCRDALARDGLPTGSSEREAKKKAYDAAKADHEKYTKLTASLEALLIDRLALVEKITEAAKSRTSLRTKHAENISMQLKRDLDGSILQIEVQARPLSEKAEFSTWLELNLDPIFPKYRQQRRTAILKSDILPSSIRAVLMDPAESSLACLKNSHERQEDGRIADDDCNKIMEACRGRRISHLDEADVWPEGFASSLPGNIRNGVVSFPQKATSLCVDAVLQLDEIVLDDGVEILLNDRPADPQSEPRSLQELSPGQKCSAILPLLLLSGEHPLVIDQPEENLDNRLIRQVIVNILASMKLRRQIIIATHNPNLPVLGDAEQCVILQASGRDLSQLVAIGNLDSPQVAGYITEIMEGGREAFQYRQSIYQAHWRSDVVDMSGA